MEAYVWQNRSISLQKRTSYFELSNFAPYGFEEDGVFWPTVEHYFQAQKFNGPGSAEYRERIRTAHSPKHAKTLGQSRSLPLQSGWEQIKEGVIRHALRKKLTHSILRQLLLSTNNRSLIENSPFDRYWGIGKDGNGRNRLGILLMEIRTEIQRETVKD